MPPMMAMMASHQMAWKIIPLMVPQWSIFAHFTRIFPHFSSTFSCSDSDFLRLPLASIWQHANQIGLARLGGSIRLELIWESRKKSKVGPKEGKRQIGHFGADQRICCVYLVNKKSRNGIKMIVKQLSLASRWYKRASSLRPLLCLLFFIHPFQHRDLSRPIPLCGLPRSRFGRHLHCSTKEIPYHLKCLLIWLSFSGCIQERTRIWGSQSMSPEHRKNSSVTSVHEHLLLGG